MTPNAVIATRDEQLAADLQEWLRTDFGCRAKFAPDFRAAVADLDQDPTPALFIDLQSESVESDTAALWSDLYSRRHRVPTVVTLSNRGYLLNWAAQADAAIAGHLSLPLCRKQLGQVVRTLGTRQPIIERNGKADRERVRFLESRSLRFVTHTAALFSVLDQLERVATHDVTLLLIGETGTGKTTLAQLVHQLSPRAAERFTTVACGALPPDLIESELFGHVRGAFTGADRAKLGRFEAAERGTLLLDEIDVLGPKEQAKLLRVIETGEFEPVGSPETRISQARLIVASNVDLKDLVEKNLFRSDLYYRLNVLEFHLPPLRERPRDIVPMALEFVVECCQQFNIRIDRVQPNFLERLKSYSWPGNIRELKNQIRRAVLFARNGELAPDDITLPFAVDAADSTAIACVKGGTLSEQVEVSEREILEEALRTHNYKRTATAQSLGISRVGLYKKMRKYGMLTANGQGTSGNGNANGKGAKKNDAHANGHGANGNGNGNGNGTHAGGNGAHADSRGENGNGENGNGLKEQETHDDLPQSDGIDALPPVAEPRNGHAYLAAPEAVE